MMLAEIIQEGKSMPNEISHSGMPFYADELRGFWKGDVLWNSPLAYFTTFKVGGPAHAVIMPTNIKELSKLIEGLSKHDIPWRVIGRGSNILVPDEGFPGVVIVLGQPFSGIMQLDEDDDGVVVRADAGCGLVGLLQWTIKNGLSGLEFSAGIPGSVGGALVMNAGAHGQEIGDFILDIGLMDSKGVYSKVDKDHCHFSYRSLAVQPSSSQNIIAFGGAGSSGGEQFIILSGTFRFLKAQSDKVKSFAGDLSRKRRESQPQSVASAGSFFKNPEKEPAGRLIEKAGLKGLRIGGAVISHRHANFIYNAGGATASDIIELKQLVQEKVWSQSGIMLEPEVDIWVKKDGKHH